METEVDSIVFDVGKVLYDFTFDKFFVYLREHGLTLTNKEFWNYAEVNSFEHGHITPEQFISNVLEMTKNTIDKDQVVNYWRDIFTEDQQMLNLLTSLKENGYKVFLLSNTSEIHWDYLKSRYKIHNLAHDLMASFEVGAMKPDFKIYQSAEEKFSLTKEKTIFIDDMEENIIGAKAFGWKGILHKNHEGTSKNLKIYGVRFSSITTASSPLP